MKAKSEATSHVKEIDALKLQNRKLTKDVEDRDEEVRLMRKTVDGNTDKLRISQSAIETLQAENTSLKRAIQDSSDESERLRGIPIHTNWVFM